MQDLKKARHVGKPVQVPGNRLYEIRSAVEFAIWQCLLQFRYDIIGDPILAHIYLIKSSKSVKMRHEVRRLQTDRPDESLPLGVREVYANLLPVIGTERWNRSLKPREKARKRAWRKEGWCGLSAPA